jgi:hypothetical protein
MTVKIELAGTSGCVLVLDFHQCFGSHIGCLVKCLSYRVGPVLAHPNQDQAQIPGGKLQYRAARALNEMFLVQSNLY